MRRLFISADIEGLIGVVLPENARVGAAGYDAACVAMTDAVLAVAEAAHAEGIAEVVVADSHATGQNIDLSRMPAYVELVQSWPRQLGMMQGVDEGRYEAAVLLGYHASAGNPEGVLAHTFSSEFLHEIRLNDVAVSEARISAALAGHFGVPVAMLAGDDAFIRESGPDFPGAATAVLKVAHGLYSARSVAPAVSGARLAAATIEALRAAPSLPTYRIEGPVCVDLRLRTRFVAEWLSYLAAVERRDAYSVRYHARDIVDVSRFLMFLAFARRAVS